ncbi:restriction endonuclease subunit S [Marinilabilia rubra]|uniref:Restriction endonuclease subunit S n=1 Tax=Marinilabilia rubra TaxID=2162893 RepID=A0A2U2B589_9BACT|nr:restriction endonuclease subunit S [Marinilabilia rubra]PWD98241.1 restriction endonuclease subunit S [Marinilabilia rubra]
MKQHNNIPQLRFPEFDGEWEEKKFGDLSEKIKSGKDKNVASGRFPLYGSMGVIGKAEKPTYVGQFILVARVGANAGKIRFVEGDFGVTDNTLIIENTQEIDVIFGFFLLTVANLNRYVFGSGQPLVTGSMLKKLSVSIPTLPEQQKIAQFLTSVDKRIQLLTCKKEQLEFYKKGAMQKIFNREIRFKNENGKEFPEWEEKKLGEVCKIRKGQQLNKIELENEGAYPAQNGGVVPSGFTDQWNCNEDTITISEGGNSCGYVNYMKTKFWCGGHCYTILNLKKEINDIYLYQFLKIKQAAIMRLRVGSGLPNIQKVDLLKFELLLPSYSEQQKIAQFLTALDKKIEHTTGEIEKMKEWKRGLLQKMFV